MPFEIIRGDITKGYELPLISSGAFGYPKDQALRVSVTAIRDFLLECEISIDLVVFDKASFGFSQELFTSISQYIDDYYVAQHDDRNRRRSIYGEDEQRFSYEIAYFIA
ncbi:MAG: hypothetical protein RR415_14590, partial [Ruthenibacterium sp.]